ncbi:MAG: alpha/beta hydrolase [Flavobacteriales bacterium]|nr:alpha/beta hydrolase [Flavobacteriales bacterium]
MSSNKKNIEITNGIRLRGYEFEPDNPIAIIVLVHGMGEHVLRHEYLIDNFFKNDIGVIGFDLRGHGISDGKRGHALYEDLMSDITAQIEFAKSKYPELPIFLFGHSLGGNLVLNHVLRFNLSLDGVIVSSPWLRLAFEPPKFKVALGKMVSSLLPGLIQKSELDTKAISQDLEEVKKYEEDALVHDKISAGMFFGVREAGEWALENASKWSKKLLLYHGSGDRITSLDASKAFADKIEEGHLVQYEIIDGAFHEIHNDLKRNDLFLRINNWIDATLGRDLIAEN